MNYARPLHDVHMLAATDILKPYYLVMLQQQPKKILVVQWFHPCLLQESRIGPVVDSCCSYQM